MNYKQTFGKTIREDFAAFHKANPHVYREFYNQVRRRKKRHGALYGHRAKKDRPALKISAKAIINWLRWEIPFQTTDQNFKINDAFGSYYARLYVALNPDDKEYFEFRKLRNEELGPYMEIDHEGQISFT